MEHNDSRRAAIARLNDAFRSTFFGGRVHLTRGVAQLDAAHQARLLQAVRTAPIEIGDDPWGEHDFGALNQGGVQYFWKIDCYDRDLKFASPDAADPSATCRVLTIMRADEY
jgi:hypothetical protein